MSLWNVIIVLLKQFWSALQLPYCVQILDCIYRINPHPANDGINVNYYVWHIFPDINIDLMESCSLREYKFSII